MPFHLKHNLRAFSLVEVCVAIAVCALFGAAAFATNQRLLYSLASQRETAAATMMLQERMETFRGLSYSNVGDKTFVKNNLVSNATNSEAALPNLTETITISGYLTTAGTEGNYPTDGTHANQWIRDSSHTTGQEQDHSDTLATDNNLLKVNILLSWKSKDGRTRTRSLSSVFGKGNIGS